MNHTRRQSWQGAAAALPVLAVVATGCGTTSAASASAGHSHSASATPAAATIPTSTAPYGVNCRSSQLRLAAGPRVSEATQQETLLLVLRNVSAAGCDIQGYPGVALLASQGRSLGFAYRRRGDQMLTNSAPAVVALAPGATAYIGVNKNACVTHASAVVRQVAITPPGAKGSLTLALPASRVLDYCASGDPGHTVDIAPVEPSLSALHAQH